jgi:hypothetical protein
MPVIFILLISLQSHAYDFKINADRSQKTGTGICESFGKIKAGCDQKNPAMCARNAIVENIRFQMYPKNVDSKKLFDFLKTRAFFDLSHPSVGYSGAMGKRELKDEASQKLLNNYKLDPQSIPSGTLLRLSAKKSCSGGIGIVCDSKVLTLASAKTTKATDVKVNLNLVSITDVNSCIEGALVPSEWVDWDDYKTAQTALMAPTGGTNVDPSKAKP